MLHIIAGNEKRENQDSENKNNQEEATIGYKAAKEKKLKVGNLSILLVYHKCFIL